MRDGTPMEIQVLNRAWREATYDLRPSADFVGRVVRGGRRRATHRRMVTVLAGISAVVVILTTVGLVAAGGGPAPTAADPRLAEPTHGDLAGDQQLLADAVNAWREGVQVSYNADRGIFDDPRSAPHVYWAGTTPAGPAAVVVQRFYLHDHDNLQPTDADQMQTLVGLVGTDPTTRRFVLLGDQYRPDGYPEPGYFQFGPGDRTILVLQRDVPVYLSTRPTLGPDGRTTREWRPLTFADGVAVTEIPAEDHPDAVRLLARATAPEPGDKNSDGLLHLERASTYLALVDRLREGKPNTLVIKDNRLPWYGGDSRESIGCKTTFWEALNDWGTLDIGLRKMGYGHWCVVAELPNGTTALVSEVQQNDDPSRVYAVIAARDGRTLAVEPGNVVDVRAALPVVVRLPGRQGWVVASYGNHLAYRTTAGGAWIDAGADAALLPDAAVDVQVNAPAGPVAVTLDR